LLELNNSKTAKAYNTLSYNMQRYTTNPQKRGTKMRRSKLETYVAILSVLANKGPLKLTHIMYKANVNCSILRENLDFLIKQNLVEERSLRKERTVFAVTPRGINMLKHFRELTKILPIVEEARTNRAPLLY
jgi:predicted transcriptional regulator